MQRLKFCCACTRSTFCGGRCTDDSCRLHMRSKPQHHRKLAHRFGGQTALEQWTAHPRRAMQKNPFKVGQQPMATVKNICCNIFSNYGHSMPGCHQDPDLQEQQKYTDAKGDCSRCDGCFEFLRSCGNSRCFCPMTSFLAECRE